MELTRNTAGCDDFVFIRICCEMPKTLGRCDTQQHGERQYIRTGILTGPDSSDSAF